MRSSTTSPGKGKGDKSKLSTAMSSKSAFRHFNNRTPSSTLTIHRGMRNYRLHKYNPNFYCTTVALFLLLLVESAVAQSLPPELLSSLKWRLIGPFRGGRVVAVAGVPGDSTTFYFGAVSGGIWKTTDAGMVWRPIFDNQPVASIGALAVAPSDPNVIYAGTGESDIRSDLSSGNGVYKSADGGSTWTPIGLADTRQISRIVIDPTNANIVFVGALGHAYAPTEQRGVFKSVDGGAHWTKVLDQGPEIGVSDLAICSSNPQLLFAGTWHTHRPPWSTYAPIDGPGGGIFRSNDGGKTWSRLAGNGLPQGDWGRIGIDVTPDGKRIYALIEAKLNPAKQSGLYRSDDSGDTWALMNADPRLTSRAWYFNRITTDPQNPNVVYVPNVALYRSEDGGKTISIVRGAPGGDDYHQLWIDPKNSSSMVLGTDQGTTVSLDRGQTWSSWYNQPTAQLYHVITDNQFPYVVYGAQQDTGSAAVPSRTDHAQITPRDWFPSGESESGYMAPDPKDPNIIYLSGAYGTVSRFDRRTSFSQDVSPWPVQTFGSDIAQRKYRAPWTPPLLFSPADPATLYLGTQFVMQTVDGGLHWETISPDLTGSIESSTEPGPPTIENAKQRGYGVVFTIAPSDLNPDLIWAGSDTGLIHLTRDGGKAWKDVTPSGLNAWSKISFIEASHFDTAVAYVAVDRSRLDDRSPYLYRTRDYGATWQPITHGIAANSFLRVVREDPEKKKLLFAGTESGVYVSFDDGDDWQPLQLNLPVTSVRDLALHGDDLIIATHGRSFWILDNITPLRQATDAVHATPFFLYRPATAVRIDNDSFPGTPLPPEEPTAENPPTGAIIDYFLRSSARTIKLEIIDPQQKVVHTFSSEDQHQEKQAPLPVAERWLPKPEVLQKTPGLRRFMWDLTWYSSGGPSADEDSSFRNPRGPEVIPGIYQVRLTVDGNAQTQQLKVVMDPRSSASSEILEAQLQLAQKMFAEVLEARRALAEITSAQKQLVELAQKLKDKTFVLKSSMTDVQAQIAKIIGKNETAPEQSSGLQEAYSDLASALRVVETGDRAVPSQARALYQESSQRAKTGMAQWQQLKGTNLRQLNQKLCEGGLTTIPVTAE
jgi:photosystem II stability/assembly factor-like uncharacterized protein